MGNLNLCGKTVSEKLSDGETTGCQQDDRSMQSGAVYLPSRNMTCSVSDMQTNAAITRFAAICTRSNFNATGCHVTSIRSSGHHVTGVGNQTPCTQASFESTATPDVRQDVLRCMLLVRARLDKFEPARPRASGCHPRSGCSSLSNCSRPSL